MDVVISRHLEQRCAERDIPVEQAKRVLEKPLLVGKAISQSPGEEYHFASASFVRGGRTEWLSVVYRDDGDTRIGFTAYWGRPGGQGSRRSPTLPSVTT